MYKVTVGVCCYRQKEWLYRCLRSLANQTLSHDDYEVILINDEPGEDLREVHESFESDHALNIRLINNRSNLGLPGSLNEILRRAKGQYFIRVDADDYVSRHILYVLSLFLEMNQDYQAVTSDYRKVNEVGRRISTHQFVEEPIACGVMFTYESLCNLRFYSEQFRMREGHDLFQRFQEKYSVCHLPFPLYRYRMHENNRTADGDEVAKYDTMLKTTLTNGRDAEPGATRADQT